MRSLTSAVLLLVSIAAPLRAQEPTLFEKHAAKIQYRMAEDGRLQMQPNATFPTEKGPFADIVDPTFATVFRNAGTLGYLAVALHGDTDLASIADSETILGRLGRTGDAQLFAVIAQEPDGPYHETLLRLLAIRYVAHQNNKPAIGVLEKSIENGIRDPHVLRAAKQAVAKLQGAAVELEWKDHVPLAKLLEQTTGRIDYVVTYDMGRLPPAHRTLAWARAAGLSLTQRFVARSGGNVAFEQVAMAYHLSEAPGVAPYEAARRFGNQRISRIVLAGRMPSEDEPMGTQWARVEGAFDIDRLYAGLAETSLKNGIGKKDDSIDVSVAGNRIVMTRDALTIRPEQTSESAVIVDHVQLASAVGMDDAPIVIYLREGVVIPGLPLQIVKFGLPRRIAVWVPRTRNEPLRLRVTCPTTQMAGLLEAQVKNLSRQYEMIVQNVPDSKFSLIEPLLDALDELELEREGTTVTVAISVKEIDIDEMLDAALKSPR